MKSLHILLLYFHLFLVSNYLLNVHEGAGSEHEELWNLKNLQETLKTQILIVQETFSTVPGSSEAGLGSFSTPTNFLKFVPFAEKGSEVKLLERRFKTSKNSSLRSPKCKETQELGPIT